MRKNITINDETDIKQLLNKINEYENASKVTVLSMRIDKFHNFTLIEFNGYTCTKWKGNICDFIRGIFIMNIIDLFA